MVSSINSVNQYIPNMQDLEIIRRLQSLGLNPTGNKAFDRQRLQAAEIHKKQKTLAPNSEPALNKLEGTGRDFSTTFSVVQSTQPASYNEVQNGLINSVKEVNDVKALREMRGAEQIAELNKFRLGLIA